MSDHCPACAAPLAREQRYCVNCGARLVEPPRPAPEQAPTPPARKPRALQLHLGRRTGMLMLPDRRAAAALTAGVLAAGVLIGVAVGPVAAGSSAADQQRIVALMGASKPPAASTSSPSGTSSTDTSGTSGGPSADTGTGGAASGLPAPSLGSSSGAAAASSASTNASSNTSSSSANTASNTSTDTSSTPTTTTPTNANTTPAASKPAKLNLTGVVVSSDNQAQSFDLVDAKGQLHEVHPDGKTPNVGSTVTLATRKLANGTLEATRSKTGKQALKTSVQLKGVVSYVNQAKNRYVLSARGVSLLVAAASTSVPPLPVVGRELKLQLALPAPGASAAALAKGLLEQTRTDAGAAKPPLELTGVITSIDEVAHKLTISADGQNTSGDTIVLAVPTSIKLKGLIAQEAVVAHATVAPDGSYTFYGADADTGITAADDSTNQIGDFVPKKQTRKHAGATRLAASHPSLSSLLSVLSGYPTLRQGANAFLEPSSAGASSG